MIFWYVLAKYLEDITFEKLLNTLKQINSHVLKFE